MLSQSKRGKMTKRDRTIYSECACVNEQSNHEKFIYIKMIISLEKGFKFVQKTGIRIPYNSYCGIADSLSHGKRRGCKGSGVDKRGKLWRGM
jgi:hypothetical protein